MMSEHHLERDALLQIRLPLLAFATHSIFSICNIKLN
jgi:hypothetical protein